MVVQTTPASGPWSLAAARRPASSATSPQTCVRVRARSAALGPGRTAMSRRLRTGANFKRRDGATDRHLTLQRRVRSEVVLDVRNAGAVVRGETSTTARTPPRPPVAEVDRIVLPGALGRVAFPRRTRSPYCSSSIAVRCVPAGARRTDGLEREPQPRGGWKPPLQMQRQAIGRNDVEADAGQEHHAARLGRRVPGLKRLVDGNLAGEVEIVGVRAHAAFGEGLGGVFEWPRAVQHDGDVLQRAVDRGGIFEPEGAPLHPGPAGDPLQLGCVPPGDDRLPPEAGRLARDVLADVAGRAVDHESRRHGDNGDHPGSVGPTRLGRSTWPRPGYEALLRGRVRRRPQQRGPDATLGRVDMGCTLTFREFGGFGYQFSETCDVIASVEHVSHASFCSGTNPGLTQVGVRIGYRF